MKKLLSILLIMLMSATLCVTSAGCGRTVQNDRRTESDEREDKDKDDDKGDDRNDADDGKDSGSKNDDDRSEESEEVTTTAPEETTSEEQPPVEMTAIPENFEKVVLVDDANCTFAVTGIEWDEYEGYRLKVSLVNKTDTELMYSLEYAVLNGFMCDPYWACSVGAGQTNESQITWYNDELTFNDISVITDIELWLEIYNSDNMFEDALVADTYELYPFGKEASRTYERAVCEKDIVLVDNEEITVIVTDIGEDEYDSYCMSIYAENKTDKPLEFTMDEVSVNGFMNDPYWSMEVLPGKKANGIAGWDMTAFEMTGVERVTDIEFNLHVFDCETFGDEYKYSDNAIVYPCGKDAYQIYEHAAQDTDVLLFDNEYASMAITGYDTDDIWGFCLYAYLENKTDTDMWFCIEDTTVNGIDCKIYWDGMVCAGKKAYVTIMWSTYVLENIEIDMESISNIEIDMEVTDNEDYTKDAYIDERYGIAIEAAATPKENTDTILYKGTGYTISVPATWTENYVDNAELAFYYEATSNDGFIENINIMVQDLSAYNMDLEAYKELSLSQYKEIGYNVISVDKGDVDGIDAYSLLTTTSAALGDGSVIECVIGQVFVVYNKNAYVFTFAADEAGYSLLCDEVFTMFTSVDFQ